MCAQPLLSGSDKSEGITVTVLDHVTGETQEQYVPPGDYVVFVTDPAEVSFQTYGNGTHVITVKGRIQR